MISIAAPAVADDFIILRCNKKVGGGSWRTGLDVIFPDERVRHRVGEPGLTRQVAQDEYRAVAWVRARYPERTAQGRAYYNDNCGRRRDPEDDEN